MIKESTISKRYARALAESIQNEKEYMEIREQLQDFLNLLNKNAEFKSGLETLLLSKKQKSEMLESIKDNLGFREKTFNFLLALLEENRMIYLDIIIKMLETFWFEKNGIEKLKVFSVIELSQEQKNNLIKQLEKSLKKKIKLENEKDPSLIAGIKIQRGSVFYDFSIDGNLKKLKDILTEVSIPEPFIKIGVQDANKG